jgi:four helix bundle protein
MSYRKSAIYQEAFALAVEVEKICRSFPRHEIYCLASQLRRASRSIGANYVEGYVRQALKVDQRRFLVYSQGSCDETKYWLEVAKAIGLLDQEHFMAAFGRCEHVSIMLLAVLRKLS